MKISFSVFILLSIATFCFASRSVSVSQVQGDECVELGQFNRICFPCEINGKTNYYSLFGEDRDFFSYVFEDSTCSTFAGYGIINENEDCIPSTSNLCEFYVKVLSVSFFELEISSESPITASYYTDELISSKLSQNSLVARGERLEGLFIRNDDHLFRYERRVSANQYSSTFGVFSYGEIYSLNDFKFSVTPITISSLPSTPIPPVLINFYPFYTAAVNEENVEYSFVSTTQGGEFLLAAEPSSLSFPGLSFSNFLFGVHNITLYPEFQYQSDYYSGNIVAQFGREESPFYTFPCYLSTSEIRGESVDIYECEFDSFSFSGWPSLSFWSFSFEEREKDRKDRPDQMAFSLF